MGKYVSISKINKQLPFPSKHLDEQLCRWKFLIGTTVFAAEFHH